MTPSGECPPDPTRPWGTTPCPPRHRGGHVDWRAPRTSATPCPPRHRGGQAQVHHATVGDKPVSTTRPWGTRRLAGSADERDTVSTTPPWGTSPCPPRCRGGLRVFCGGWPSWWLQVPSRDVGPAELVHCHPRGDPVTLANRMFLSRTGTRAKGRRRTRRSAQGGDRCVVCDPREAQYPTWRPHVTARAVTSTRYDSWRCHVTARAVTSTRCDSWRCHVTARAVTLTHSAALRRLR